jgi:hypothetical protein
MMFSDWTDEDPMRILHKLKNQSDYYNRHLLTVGQYISDVKKNGLASALDERQMWNEIAL